MFLQVMRRKKTSTKSQHMLQQQRASFPLSRPQFSESRVAQNIEQQFNNHSLSHNGGLDSSQDHLEGNKLTTGVYHFRNNLFVDFYFRRRC